MELRRRDDAPHFPLGVRSPERLAVSQNLGDRIRDRVWSRVLLDLDDDKGAARPLGIRQNDVSESAAVLQLQWVFD
jgi:hypothetical protein